MESVTLVPTLPESCQKCKRWALMGPQYHKVLPSIYAHNPEHSNVEAVFVISSPDEENTKAGRVFDVGEAAELFHAFAQRLRINYTIVSVAMCGGQDTVSKRQIEKCREHVAPILEGMDPKCFVLLGETPRDAFLGNAVAIQDAHLNVFKYLRDGRPAVSCLLAPDPRTQFFTKNAKDLRPVLAQMFELLDKIVKGTYVPWNQECDWELINTGSRSSDMWKFKGVLEKLEMDVSFDCEFDVNNEESIMQEGKGALVTIQSAGWSPSEHKYKAVVMDVRDWDVEELRELFHMVFLGKIIVGSFLQIDMQCVWVNTAEVSPQDGNFVNGVKVECFARDWDDGQAVDFMQDQSIRGSGLKNRCARDFQFPNWGVFWHAALKRAAAKGGRGVSSEIPAEEIYTLYEYAANDAYAEIKHWRERGKRAAQDIVLAYAEFKETTITLLELSRQGMKVDVPKLEKYKTKLEGEINVLQIWLDSHPYVLNAGLTQFNSKSPLQVTAVCRHNNIVTSETETGLACVNKDTLPLLAGSKDASKRVGPTQHFFGVLWDQRRKRDMVSKFINPFLLYQNNGWVHPLYSNSKQDETSDTERGTTTSRMASNYPNVMGQIDDPDYMACFPAPEGHVVVAQDFKTGEPVINAYLSQCTPLMQAFELGARHPGHPDSDPYRLFMAKRLGKATGALTKAERNQGKVPWLSAVYGQFPATLAATSNGTITEQDAEGILYEFYQDYPQILAREAEVRRKLFAGDMFISAMGRRRSFKLGRSYAYQHEKHRNYMGWQLVKELRMSPSDAEALRQAGNNEIQGALGIIMFYFMTWFRKYRHSYGLEHWRLFVSIHDSVKFYVPDDERLKGDIARMHDFMSAYWNYLPEQVIKNLGFPDSVHRLPVLQNDGKIGEHQGDMIAMEDAIAGDWEFVA